MNYITPEKDMSIRVALIVSAPRELSLTAGREELEPTASPSAEADLPFLNVGRVAGDEIHLSGPLIGDPDHIGASLTLFWYLPDEEPVDNARPVDPDGAKIVIATPERPAADQGWRWRYLLESRKPCLETKFYSTGYQPPFKASDLTIHLEHLINFNYDGYLISKIDYHHRPPSYIEAEWRLPAVEAQGYLDD